MGRSALMQEIFPGVLHWTAFHEGIEVDVSSYYIEPAGVVIDPVGHEDYGQTA